MLFASVAPDVNIISFGDEALINSYIYSLAFSTAYAANLPDLCYE